MERDTGGRLHRAPGPQIETHASVCSVCSAPWREKESAAPEFFRTMDRDCEMFHTQRHGSGIYFGCFRVWGTPFDPDSWSNWKHWCLRQIMKSLRRKSILFMETHCRLLSNYLSNMGENIRIYPECSGLWIETEEIYIFSTSYRLTSQCNA